MVDSRNSWAHDRGLGPQERFFKSMVGHVLGSMGLKTSGPLPGSKEKPKGLIRSQHEKPSIWWYTVGRLTPGEYVRLRHYANAAWRLRELAAGTKAWMKAKADMDAKLRRVPAYVREHLPPKRAED